MDKYLKALIEQEHTRQKNEVVLIASENYTSQAVMDAQGSVLTQKYAEGYPGKRYYGGCGVVDQVEKLAIDQATLLFGCKYANVQPHSGSQANAAVYQALLPEGGKVLGMSLDAGGHLTHGHPLNISGKRYDFHGYNVNDDGVIDINIIERLAHEVKPNMIVMGFSAYSGEINEELLAGVRRVCDDIGAYFMFDMAHIAGLVAAGCVQSPVKYADVVTTTTHKTLRGPRGGMILWNNDELSRKLNSAVFPGTQGGPLMHVIAAKAQCFIEAQTHEFKMYSQQVIDNAKVMANIFQSAGIPVVGGQTHNHMLLLDVSAIGMTGAQAEKKLQDIGIIVNKNMIPNDKNPPMVTSGIRIGTPAMTTRGMNTAVASYLACTIAQYFNGTMSEHVASSNVQMITELCPLKV